MSDVNSINWKALAKEVQYPNQAIINGKNVDSLSGKTEARLTLPTLWSSLKSPTVLLKMPTSQ